MNNDSLQNWEKKSKEKQKVYKRFLENADKNKVLKQLPGFHEEAFEKIDCLKCANCCRNYSPRFKTPDIKRISKHLKIKPSEFTGKYLRIDEDNDFVFKSMPCPFLALDNYCSIYEVRPKACKNYPHTDRRKFVQLLDITLKNTAVCPGVYEIVNKMRVVL